MSTSHEMSHVTILTRNQDCVAGDTRIALKVTDQHSKKAGSGNRLSGYTCTIAPCMYRVEMLVMTVQGENKHVPLIICYMLGFKAINWKPRYTIDTHSHTHIPVSERYKVDLFSR